MKLNKQIKNILLALSVVSSSNYSFCVKIEKEYEIEGEKNGITLLEQKNNLTKKLEELEKLYKKAEKMSAILEKFNPNNAKLKDIIEVNVLTELEYVYLHVLEFIGANNKDNKSDLDLFFSSEFLIKLNQEKTYEKDEYIFAIIDTLTEDAYLAEDYKKNIYKDYSRKLFSNILFVYENFLKIDKSKDLYDSDTIFQKLYSSFFIQGVKEGLSGFITQFSKNYSEVLIEILGIERKSIESQIKTIEKKMKMEADVEKEIEIIKKPSISKEKKQELSSKLLKLKEFKTKIESALEKTAESAKEHIDSCESANSIGMLIKNNLILVGKMDKLSDEILEYLLSAFNIDKQGYKNTNPYDFFKNKKSLLSYDPDSEKNANTAVAISIDRGVQSNNKWYVFQHELLKKTCYLLESFENNQEFSQEMKDHVFIFMLKLAEQNKSCETGFIGRIFPFYLDVLKEIIEKEIKNVSKELEN